MSYSLEQLRTCSKSELIDAHDRLAKSTSVGISYYLDEISRRDAQEVNDSMLKLTKSMHHYTMAMTVMTFVMLVATVVNVIIALCK